MKTNRLVTAELGMQVRAILTSNGFLASVLPILGVFVHDTTRYSFFGGKIMSPA